MKNTSFIEFGDLKLVSSYFLFDFIILNICQGYILVDNHHIFIARYLTFTITLFNFPFLISGMITIFDWLYFYLFVPLTEKTA